MHSSSGQVPCSYHPDVMTGLRCTNCGKPICPKDAVRTPVGLRCPDCAGVRRMGTIRTPTNDLAKSLGAGLLVAVVVAVLWRFIPSWGFYLSLAMGFGVVEAIARFTRNKRGTDLQIAAMAVITVGFLLSRALLAQRYGLSIDSLTQLNGMVWNDAVRDTYGYPRAVGDLLRLQAVPDLIYMALAYIIAWVRFR
ncbi:MAG TPA: hypothetical protein VNZ55_07470 [Thermomicrobiales bacterium]|nr:hypothetical protein [Thermomicrobiales bacterium]